ncbi:MAG: hypothetical protein LRS47_04075, partial [Desulfurococcales archaeon]|nr:hypothetical protein [Desulfurococcales archaeon]
YSGRGKGLYNVYSEPLSWILGILSICFAFLGLNMFRLETYRNMYYDGLIAGLIFGVVLHEMAHKYSGRKLGCASMYVVTLWGLLITMASGFFPIKLIVPGYTSIVCYYGIGRKEDAEISAWGPAVNIILSSFSLVLYKAGLSMRGFMIGFAEINAWLALFNLLPIPPLDGSKIMRYRMDLWLAMIIFALMVFVLL